MHLQNYLATPLVAYLEWYAATTAAVGGGKKKKKGGSQIVNAGWTLKSPANDTLSFNVQPQAIERLNDTSYLMQHEFSFSQTGVSGRLGYGLHYINNTHNDRVTIDISGKVEVDQTEVDGWICEQTKKETSCWLPMDQDFDNGRGESMRFELEPNRDRSEWRPSVRFRNEKLGNAPVLRLKRPDTIAPEGSFMLTSERKVKQCSELGYFWTMVSKPNAGKDNNGNFTLNSEKPTKVKCKGELNLDVNETKEGLNVVVGNAPEKIFTDIEVEVDPEHYFFQALLEEYD